ncbi:MAG: ABC transporter permease [Candidatus Aminicenantes bacterium]|nr:MAG: ABC transporter permease [Candidatus Aminicenantes bacterium]
MATQKSRPPKIAGWVIKHTARYEENFAIHGDFNEEFHEIASRRGIFIARLWFWRQCLRSFPVFLKDSFYWRLIMFKNYMKIAFRSLKKHKGYSFINISGLAIGMAVCVLIFMWILNELSYDRFHEKADNICRLTLDIEIGSMLHTPVSLTAAGPALVEDFPEVIAAARVDRPRMIFVKYKDKTFQEADVGFAENEVFDIFTFPFISGDPKTALQAPNTVVITESTAQKYFGDEDPIGKILRFNNETDFSVTGVVKDIPHNSHFRFNMLRSFQTLMANGSVRDDMWFDLRFFTYLLLDEFTDPSQLEQKFPGFIDNHLGDAMKATGGTVRLFLQPLKKIHLYSDFERDISANSDITYVYLFSAIAFFVLLIAGINFINLSTARSATRAQEVGMRKTLGAIRSRLIGQFLGESMIHSFLAMGLAIVFIILSLPFFNTVIGTELTLNFFQSPWLLAAVLGMAIIVGVCAGSYPAFILSSFPPVHVLKGLLKAGGSHSRFRKILVVFQFSISIALIAATIIVYQQIIFMKNTELGFDKEHVVIIPRMSETLRKSYRSIRSEMRDLSGVVDVGASDLVPSRGHLVGTFLPEGFADDQILSMDYMNVDAHYIPTMGMEILEGRNFSEDFSTDPNESVLINETAAKKIGWKNPVGKRFVFRPPPNSGREVFYLTVIGVVKDFHLQSLREKIEPLIIFYDYNSLMTLSVRIAPDNVPHTMGLIEKKWKELDPNRPFNFLFLDESFDSLYRQEDRLKTITFYFSFLAILIGCLGLFGMASFTAEQRTKEIGIRKVLGASVLGIIRLLAKEFMLLVIVANLIALPVAYFAMNRWLQSFAYRMDIHPIIFVLAAALSLSIALLTVSYQAIRAALANPVDSLRYE